MKKRNFIIFAVAFFTLCKCKDPSKFYPNVDIVIDNAQAMMYYHIIFREVENAWAIVDNKGFKEFTPIMEENGRQYKELEYFEDSNVAEIEYHTWGANKLNGNIRVDFDNTWNYRKKEGYVSVMLTGFSINDQHITGGIKIKYIGDEGDENDRYTFDLVGESIIHEEGPEGRNLLELITANITNANYERIAGGETLSMDDDEWKYWGVMRGKIREDNNLNYTNTVLTSYTDIDGATHDGTVHFTMGCKTAKQGVLSIVISGRSDIIYGYDCESIYYDNETIKTFY